jgi:predicted  nucleic acid-binding Zn-ribbon protein
LSGIDENRDDFTCSECEQWKDDYNGLENEKARLEETAESLRYEIGELQDEVRNLKNALDDIRRIARSWS